MLALRKRGEVVRIIRVSDFIRNLLIPEIKYPERCITTHSGIDMDKFSHRNEFGLLKQFGFDSNFKAVGNTSAIAAHEEYLKILKVTEAV